MVSISLDDMTRNPQAVMDRVKSGESLLVVQDGTPVAEIKAPAPPAKSQRPIGLCAGEFTVPSDFDAPLPDDILAAFEAS